MLTHGTSPKFIVSDGKALGPLKRKVAHLKELDIAEDDKSVLAQSTCFTDRIFLNIKKERVLVCKLVTGDISMQDFTLTSDIRSENGLLVINLVAHINQNFPLTIPDSYSTLLCNISKNSSARSLLQVTNLETLDFLREFCQENLDLRVVQNASRMKAVIKAFPALWPSLDSICSLEKTKIPPKTSGIDCSKIIIN